MLTLQLQQVLLSLWPTEKTALTTDTTDCLNISTGGKIDEPNNIQFQHTEHSREKTQLFHCEKC